MSGTGEFDFWKVITTVIAGTALAVTRWLFGIQGRTRSLEERMDRVDKQLETGAEEITDTHDAVLVLKTQMEEVKDTQKEILKEVRKS